LIDLWLIAAGIGIGFAMTIPLGPVNLMCINRALHFGFLAAFISGLGAVLADGIFAAIAAFGVDWLSGAIQNHQGLLVLAGGSLIILLGVYIIRHVHVDDPGDGPRRSLLGGGVAGFFMTITNPAGLFGFLAIFSGLQDYVAPNGSLPRTLALILAVMTGGASWYFIWSAAVSALRERITARMLERINGVSGVLLVVFGLALIGHYLLSRG
jgi:threonine/homoserine/homoserine lactone efflux protein